MEDRKIRPPTAAGWWTRLPNGGIRRVWAQKRGELFVCLREQASAEQEAARVRLAERTYPIEEGGTIFSEALMADAALVASVKCDVLETVTVAQAYAFLGGDSAAMVALLDADPNLTPALVEKSGMRRPA